MTPYYTSPDGSIILYCGDNRDVLPHLAAGSVDLVFTSPPYNLGVTTGGGFPHGLKRDNTRHAGGKWANAALALGYGVHDDAMPYPEYVAWQKATLTACWRLLSERGAIYYNHKPRVQDGILQTPLSLNPGLPVRQIVIWKRAGGMNFSPTFYCPAHEWIVIYAKRAFALTSRGASGVGDVWYVPQEADTPHPAPFPIGLPMRAIDTTPPGTVLDPFAGSGTTLVAARMAGRRAIGIELEERWCEVAARRLQQQALPLFDTEAAQ